MKWMEQAKPIISRLVSGGRTVAVEGCDNEVCGLLDKTCGIDILLVYGGEKNRLVVGVASRIQGVEHGRRPFNTFTVRKERASGTRTEYEKRKHAIEHKGIYPRLTMQAYVDLKTNEILSLAIAKTVDLIDYIEKHDPETKCTGSDKIGQADFYVIPWDDYKNHYKVRIYEKSEIDPCD